MNQKSFTRHALRRLTERTSVSVDYLLMILNKRLYVNMGTKPGMTKEHLLFFSRTDGRHFIVIRDTLSGDLITVLPEDYHSNLAWVVTDAQRAEAKSLIESDWEEVETAAHCTDQNPPTTLYIKVAFEENRERKIKLVQKTAYEEQDLEKLIKNPEFLEKIQKISKEQGLDEPIDYILVHAGRKGKPYIAELNNQAW